jgi:hypothetical protein
MSSVLGKTLSIIYTIIETGTQLRREIFANRDAYLVTSDCQIADMSFAVNETLTLDNITGFFFLTVEAPLQLKINGGSYFTVQKTVSIFAPLTQVIINNPGTTAVNCKLIHS